MCDRKWLPMETAPKDGTLIDVLSSYYVLHDMAKGIVRKRCIRITHAFFEDEQWVARIPESTTRIILSGRYELTHWMPLPDTLDGEKMEWAYGEYFEVGPAHMGDAT